MCQTATPMPECLVILGRALAVELPFPKCVWCCAIVAGTQLIFDALVCPYRMGERVRALKLLRAVTSGMLLMWDRGLHSYAMGQATLAQGCDYLGRVPANVKFVVEQTFEDGSYLTSDCSVWKVKA